MKKVKVNRKERHLGIVLEEDVFNTIKEYSFYFKVPMTNLVAHFIRTSLLPKVEEIKDKIARERRFDSLELEMGRIVRQMDKAQYNPTHPLMNWGKTDTVGMSIVPVQDFFNY